MRSNARGTHFDQIDPLWRAPLRTASHPEVDEDRGNGVVHITAECWPYARTGGLGETVSTLAAHHAAMGVPSTIIMPLYALVRREFPDLRLAAPPVGVRLGEQTARVRFWKAAGDERQLSQPPRVVFVEHPGFTEREGLYGEHGNAYPDNPQRFAWFCAAAVAALPWLAPAARVLHAHDWHASLALVYLRTTFAASPFHRRLASVLSVHNAAFQGLADHAQMKALGLSPNLFDWRILEWYGQVNLLKGGIAYADRVATVSRTHAAELRHPCSGFGLHGAFGALGERLVGIVNGIDQHVWNPATDVELAAPYSASSLGRKRRCKAALQRAFGLPERADVPIIAMCARLAEQKGWDLVLDGPLLSLKNVQFVFVGEGERRYADALRVLAAAATDRIAVQTRFTDRSEHLLMGGSDLFLLPSKYEPCGLSQMRAQRYGAIPIAHRVGGLADTIEDEVTGFLFERYDADALAAATTRALTRYANDDEWGRITRKAMTRDFGWVTSADEYLALYRRASGLEFVGSTTRLRGDRESYSRPARSPELRPIWKDQATTRVPLLAP